MKQIYNSTKSAKWKQIDYKKRIQIEILLKERRSPEEIGKIMGYSKRTIEREKRRGEVKTLRTKRDELAAVVPVKRSYKEVIEYSADVGQISHDGNGSRKGRQLKIGRNYELAEYIEEKIGKEKLSPYAALEQAKIENKPFAG
jgi:IS30 family transposase